MRAEPPTSVDETISFGAYDASAEPVNTSAAKAAAAETANLLVFLMCLLSPFGLLATGGDERSHGHPVDLVVTNELRLRDRVVVARRRDDLDPGPQERVDLIQMCRRSEQRRTRRVLAGVPQGVDHRVGDAHSVEVVGV